MIKPDKMTFEEKASMLTGMSSMLTRSIKRHDIPSTVFCDGPYGVRIGGINITESLKKEIPGGPTCFPTGSAMGATWNKDLMYEVASGMGKDCRELEVDLLLGPAVNMKRTPHCGRNFEYFSEDPYLSGILGAYYINGIQSEGIGTSLKHYAANNQEIDRMSINAEIDERTLREYYLKVFEIILKHSDPTSIMCSYNKINGIWASENKWLLTDILKDEWGYKGLVMSDWGAVKNISRAIKAGLDLQMPDNKNIIAELRDGINKGIIHEDDINRAVIAVLSYIEKITDMKPRNFEEYSRDLQHSLAYKAATETITLLRNNNNILPITSEKYKKIAVIGEYAINHLYKGGGSSEVSNDDKMANKPLECLKNNLKDIQIDYYPFIHKKIIDWQLIVDINQKIVGNYDCVLVFVGDNYGADCESEIFDRDNLKLPNYINAALKELSENVGNLIVVIQSGSAVIPYGWENTPSIIQMWYSGECAGEAVADILCGKVNPSGKLSETFPIRDRSDLDYPGDGVKVCYNEKLDVGYRYYDKHPEEIWFPFGHGLSYTKFEYSDISVSKKEFDSDKFSLDISLSVKNTGDCDGAEVIQLYIAPKNSIVTRPIKTLCEFEKINLKVNEQKRITFTICEDAFSYYNTCLKNCHVESGKYEILVGASSRDIRLKEEVKISYDNDYTL